MTARQIWEVIYAKLTWEQYVKVSGCYGSCDGLPSLRYSTYFHRTLRVTRDKKLRDLAIKGLSLCQDEIEGAS